MNDQVLWWLIFVQILVAGFDVIYHHALTERLAWQQSQRRELTLHGVRNFAYAVLFAVFGWLELHGALADALLGFAAAELVLTLVDFVEEDRSRRLPASERVTHAFLVLNFGAILVFLTPILLDWSSRPIDVSTAYHGWWTWLCTVTSVGVAYFGFSDFAARARLKRMTPPSAGWLLSVLPARQRFLVTGATGFVGKRLVRALIEARHEVTVLVRDQERASGLGTPITVVTRLDQIASDAAFDVIVNLAGEPLASGISTRRKCRRILASRLRMTRAVVRLIARLEKKPQVLVNASTIGWYGERGEEQVSEKSDPVPAFGHRICAAWEAEARRARRSGVRVVLLRLGLVLGSEGGLLGQMLPIFEYGFGARFGNGKQWLSWIERDDLIRLIAHVIETASLSGVVNATAPNPVRNKEFANAVASALHRPSLLVIPDAVLKLLGPFAVEILLSGQRVMPARSLATGFVFRHATLTSALKAIIPQKTRVPLAAEGAGAKGLAA